MIAPAYYALSKSDEKVDALRVASPEPLFTIYQPENEGAGKKDRRKKVYLGIEPRGASVIQWHGLTPSRNP